MKRFVLFPTWSVYLLMLLLSALTSTLNQSSFNTHSNVSITTRRSSICRKVPLVGFQKYPSQCVSTVFVFHKQMSTKRHLRHFRVSSASLPGVSCSSFAFFPNKLQFLSCRCLTMIPKMLKIHQCIACCEINMSQSSNNSKSEVMCSRRNALWVSVNMAACRLTVDYSRA